jgi:hypothetical protein
MGVLERLAEALVPGDTENWQIQIAVKHDEQGCTEIHLHTCIKQQESEESPTESSFDGAAGYL